jgi:integrase
MKSLHCLTEHQVETLTNHVDIMRDKCIISLLADSGMRVSEIAYIK